MAYSIAEEVVVGIRSIFVSLFGVLSFRNVCEQSEYIPIGNNIHDLVLPSRLLERCCGCSFSCSVASASCLVCALGVMVQSRIGGIAVVIGGGERGLRGCF